MTSSTAREPFTKPLTGPERRYIQARIDLALRDKGVHAAFKNRLYDMDWEQEVHDAIAEFEKRGEWADEPKRRSALVGA